MAIVDEIALMLRDAGAVAVGFAPCRTVSDCDMQAFDHWLADGFNAGMAYMANYRDIRRDPSLLIADDSTDALTDGSKDNLTGGMTVISMAFAYPRPAPAHAAVAAYAQGDDYHDVLRALLRDVVDRLQQRYPAGYRICIDSAPMLERYWAEQAGIGRRARNGLICVDGVGTHIFLAGIVTNLQIELPAAAGDSVADSPTASCYTAGPAVGSPCPEGCDNCLRACPAHALQPDYGCVDARRCLSYLTIEHRGEWDAIGRRAMSTPAGERTLFGCDICQRVCPLNRPPYDSGCYPILPAFQPRPEIIALTPEKIASLTPEEFSRLARRSPLKRTKLIGLRRNAQLPPEV